MMKKFGNRGLMCWGGSRKCMGSWSCFPWGVSGTGTALLFLASYTIFLCLPPVRDPAFFAGRHESTTWDEVCVWHQPVSPWWLYGKCERDLSNFPADLSARNIPLWACFSLNRILLDRSGPGSCPGVLGSVEEGPHTLLAVRNGLTGPWGMWIPLIPQPHMGLPRFDPSDSVTLYPNSTVNCIGSLSSTVGRMLRTFSSPWGAKAFRARVSYHHSIASFLALSSGSVGITSQTAQGYWGLMAPEREPWEPLVSPGPVQRALIHRWCE